MSIKLFSFINEQSWYFYLAIISFTLIAFSVESCTNSTEQNQIEQYTKSPAMTALNNVSILIDYLK